MLIEFNFSNFRSFRNETCLSMHAVGLSQLQPVLRNFGSLKLLPAVAIYGKNGGGKSNVLRAFVTGVNFIRNAQRTQTEGHPVPVTPFAFDDVSAERPTWFEYIYTFDNIKYKYGFSATSKEIIEEYLYYWPKGYTSKIFHRKGQEFSFPTNSEKKRKDLISEAVAPNQLFFSVACTMNEKKCIAAMKWFREQIYLLRSYRNIDKQMFEYRDNPKMLDAITEYAKNADFGIEDIHFDYNATDVKTKSDFPSGMPEELKRAVGSFLDALSSDPNTAEYKLGVTEIKSQTIHNGIDKNGEKKQYTLRLSDESDGTHRLMSMAPAIENALATGGVFIADELEIRLHPLLLELIVAKFQNPKTNPHNAQLIFSTHDTSLLDSNLLRKDQVYFADKRNEDGVSELYCISDFQTQTHEKMLKAYLAGKYGAIPDIEIPEV